MPTAFTTRTLTAADLPALEDLQQRYCAQYPVRVPVPAQMYLSPYFAEGRNVCCAFDSAGCLLACAPYFPQNDLAWVEILAAPGLANMDEVKTALLAWLLERARHDGLLCINFQYFPQESDSIAYAQRQGAAYAYSIYNMRRGLAEPVPTHVTPAGFTIRRWRMESEAEQRAYLDARNTCFPEAPTSLEEWQYFTTAPHWAQGVNIAAFSGETLAASVLVFFDPGSPAASTEYVFTLPAYRGQGLARALLAEALRYLQEHNLTSAQLEVKAENESALGVYHRLGYQVVAESRVYGKRTTNSKEANSGKEADSIREANSEQLKKRCRDRFSAECG